MDAIFRLAKSRRTTPVLGKQWGKWAVYGDLSVKAPDLWRGIFWGADKMYWRESDTGMAWYSTPEIDQWGREEDGYEIQAWICIVPCLPIRIMVWVPKWRKR